MMEMRKKYPSDQFAVLVMDVSNNPKLTKQYLKSIHSDYAMLMDEGRKVGRLYEIPGTPVTVIVDREGRAIFRHLGYSPGDEKMFQEEVEILLKRK